MGIGMADVTTDRLVRQIDWEPTRVNALSAGLPSRIRVPAAFASDRAGLLWVAATAGRLDPAEVTFGWIRNTLELDRLAISPNLRTQIDAHRRAPRYGGQGQQQVEVETELDVQWDESGNLLSPFSIDDGHHGSGSA
jgi:hypothetical protein